MTQHHRYQIPDLLRYLRPPGVSPKGKGLGSRRLEGCGEEGHRAYVRVEHHVVLLSRQVPEFDTPFDALLAVVGGSGLEEAEPIVHKFFGVCAGCTKVD